MRSWLQRESRQHVNESIMTHLIPVLVVQHPFCHFFLQALLCQWSFSEMRCDHRDDVANVTWDSDNLGNPLCVCEQIEDSLFIRYKPKYENYSHAVWASLQSCRVHLFCSSLYVGHVVDQRCSSSCDRWYLTAYYLKSILHCTVIKSIPKSQPSEPSSQMLPVVCSKQSSSADQPIPIRVSLYFHVSLLELEKWSLADCTRHRGSELCQYWGQWFCTCADIFFLIQCTSVAIMTPSGFGKKPSGLLHQLQTGLFHSLPPSWHPVVSFGLS